MRLTKTKTSSMKSVGGIKRICQERAQPDVTTPKAMKDPNWRTRQDTASSTDIENVMPSMDLSNHKLYTQAPQFQSNHTFQHDRSSSDFSMLDRYSSESLSASENFVRILKKIDLKPVDGRQMSIFELDICPETPTPSIASDDRQYVKVCRNPASHQRIPSSATDVTEKTHHTEKTQIPDLFQVVTLDRLCRQSSSATSSHTQLHESRSIYDRDQYHDISYESTVSHARGQTPADVAVQSPQTAIRSGRDQAFQRLIQRLNRDNHPPSAQASQSPAKMQAKDKPPEPEPKQKMFVNFRRPMGGDGRRNQTISDFNVDYWDHGQSSVTSVTSVTSREDSENTVQSSNKQNTWNPRAREFLSLGHQQTPRRPVPWDTGAPALQDKVAHTFNSLPPPTTAAWPPKAAAHTFNPYLPPRAPDNIPNGTFIPPVPPVAPMGPAYNMGPGPETFGTSQYIPGNPAPQPPLFAVPPLPGIQAPMTPFGNISAHQFAAQQLAALPYLASLASLGPFPQLLPELEKTTSLANTRRPPVPKPTLPNAGAQLAYEEWIEWRKANEPGYAVECKVRQQRRCQRVKGLKECGGDEPAQSRLRPARAMAAA
ncbi:hypothetical protein NHJ13734_008138 [Beauveria thailandica]